MTAPLSRPERLQIMLNADEIAALDDWRFSRRMPSRAAAVRDLLRRGLAVDGFDLASPGQPSASFGVLDHPAQPATADREAGAERPGRRRPTAARRPASRKAGD